MSSAIEWTDEPWNPTTGCDKVSAGCKNCYAEPMAHRLQAMKSPGYEGGFKVALHENRLSKPLLIKRPTRFFVNSMSDLFHEKIPFEFIDKVMGVIRQCPQHTFQILTKRDERMADYFAARGRAPDNAWMGVSAENEKYGIPRICTLIWIPAKIKFISAEPLLEYIELPLQTISWVIVGGESGRMDKIRECKEEWIVKISDKCRTERVKYFFKQTGTLWAKKAGYEKKGGGSDLPDLPHFRREFPAH